MSTSNLIIQSATVFYNKLQDDPFGRYRSWEHCYKCFYDARACRKPDYDYLSLQLAFYLASWGMYRGSSFLLQKDYKVHTRVVKEILNPRYDCLCGMECKDLRNEQVQQVLNGLICFMKDYYDGVRKGIKEKEVKSSLSDTLVTKILMGTLGCVPAYDRYFIEGVKDQKVTTGNCSIKSLLKLVDYYEENKEKFEEVRKKFKVYDLPYPQMKMLDMGFWQIGFEKDTLKGLKVPH